LFVFFFFLLAVALFVLLQLTASNFSQTFIVEEGETSFTLYENVN
jgi:hypothetical protein